MDTALATDPKMYLLGQFTEDNADMYYIRVIKMIYFPASYVGIFLERNLTLADVWSHLVDCLLIIE